MLILFYLQLFVVPLISLINAINKLLIYYRIIVCFGPKQSWNLFVFVFHFNSQI